VVRILQFNFFGGTIGLAQLSAVRNSQVRAYISARIQDGTLNTTDALSLDGNIFSHFTSIQSIESFDPKLLHTITDAFREGVRWAFISLIPWTALAAIAAIGLRRITEATPSTDSPSGSAGEGDEKDPEQNRATSTVASR